jgi:hypothetical protein
LAAFFLADFLVGFFLAARCAATLAADLRPAAFFRAGRVSFFLVVLPAAFFRTAFLAFAMASLLK